MTARRPLLCLCYVTGLTLAATTAASQDPPGPTADGYPVGTTNLRVAAAYEDIGDEAMHGYLLALPDQQGRPRYLNDVLAHTEAAWVIDVPVPEQPSVYGPASGLSLPLAAFIAFPAAASAEPNRYAFPYRDAQHGVFENMLRPGATPRFADAQARYPLIVYAHGASAHGIYDVSHAQALASQGYIVAVPFYGDDRTRVAQSRNEHMGFLRPLLTRALIDSLLASEAFGPHIDSGAIGISGHSFGGFTALALAGGRYLGRPETVHDPRVTAAVIAAPWVGTRTEVGEVFGFGPANRELNRVRAPVLTLFGSADTLTTAEFILPATQQLGGPSFVVELVDQPHIFEQGSWADRDGWELLFFNAYLKRDPQSLERLRSTRSMEGGNRDLQDFELQRTLPRPPGSLPQ